MKPHAPDPGCDRLKSLLVPVKDVNTREILRSHREAQGLPNHAEIISKAKAKALKSRKEPGKQLEEKKGKRGSEPKKCKQDSKSSLYMYIARGCTLEHCVVTVI